jgi:hypothetical protein
MLASRQRQCVDDALGRNERLRRSLQLGKGDAKVRVVGHKRRNPDER